MNREDFLQRATAEIRQRFAAIDKPLPERIHLSIGFPSKRAVARSGQAIGQCWHGPKSSDGNCHIFISPLHKTGAAVLDTLMHELVHVVTPGDGHRAPFVRVCNQLGLTEGKPTGREAGPELLADLERLNVKLGGYPLAVISPTYGAEKPQTTRLLKVECGECGYVCRVTKLWIETAGAPLCPVDQVAMEIAA